MEHSCFLLLDASASVAAIPQGGSSSGATVNQNSPGKYSELLAVIEELGKDIRPTYAGSKNAAERLKKGKIFTIKKAYLVTLHSNYSNLFIFIYLLQFNGKKKNPDVHTNLALRIICKRVEHSMRDRSPCSFICNGINMRVLRKMMFSKQTKVTELINFR